MENNILVLKTYVDGVNDTPFPQDADSPIEIGTFRYDAKRMGGAPTITASVNYPSCLDKEWTNKVYAEFRGERYFLKQTPTSAYDNQDTMYKHDLELVSERIILDNVYFFDTAIGNPAESDKAVSNSTKVVFNGSVHEFAKRLNASLEYTKLLKWDDGVNEEGEPIKIANGYNVVVDEGVGSEEKLMSFEDQFFSNVLQEIYNQYQVPYYFDGKTIHIGFSGDVYPHTFSYGIDNALLSITKNNANYKVVNRVTGKGSSDNITYYYPNNSPKGIIDVEASREELGVKIEDYQRFSDKIEIDGIVQFVGHDFEMLRVQVAESESSTGDDYEYGRIAERLVYSRKSGNEWFRTIIHCEGETKLHFFPITSVVELYERNSLDGSLKYYDTSKIKTRRKIIVREGQNISNGNIVWEKDIYDNNEACEIPIPREGDYTIYVVLYWNHTYSLESPNFGYFHIKYTYTATLRADAGWYYKDENVKLENIGLSIVDEEKAEIGDTITQRLVKHVNTSQNLMPSVYRHSDAKERFYNAVNYPYPWYEGFDATLEKDYYYGEDGIKRNYLGEYEVDGMIHNDAYKEANGEYIEFKNPYFEATPKEHIITVDDLKPTIKEMVNSMGLRMDMFSEFAYDLNDNDETEESEDSENSRDFKHSYFFGKLRVLDFNLFDCAIEQQPMTISFTSGDCGACNFEIGVTEEEPQRNPVQVDANGNLIRNPETGNVVCGQFEKVSTFQDRQQDTSKYEVWIALKKEEETYGILMPKAEIYEKDENGNIVYDENGKAVVKEAGHRPKAAINEDGTPNNEGDTFVILGINLPDKYIHHAEDKLRDEIIKYIKENNEEKFNFSITLSRIFFEENRDALKFLNENSRLNIEYDGNLYTLYVTSYSYNMSENDVLPEIKVELDDKLTVSQNAIQNAINSVKSEINSAFASFDVLALATPYFLRKDADDICNGTIDFQKGVKFGEGGKVEVLDNNSAKLTIEYLEVTKKASFTSLEIKEKTHVGGQIIISPAAMTCGEVEELEDVYRCYFQTKNAEGHDEIFNQFAENDLAICQTYNAWGSHYYWRKVVGVGEDYIDLSKDICDEYSDIPMAGDKIVQLGNTSDITRQAAQVLSAYGDDAPSFIMYNGINDFTLADKNITGIIWNPKTLEPQMYSYGSFYFGDRDLDEDFITFQRKDGDSKKKLHINATVNFSSDSTGLSNLEEWKEVEKDILNLNKTVEQVQDQIDGVIENWSGDYTPTIKNMPVIDWIAKGNDELVAHINDTFINISDGEDSGKAWRWCECLELDKLVQTDEIYNDIVPSREWYKIGTLDKEKGYTNFSVQGYTRSIVYDADIQIISGPPTYVKFESATNDIYVLDAYGYFEAQNLSFQVSYNNFVQVTLQDGSSKSLHWHQIVDTDAVNALKEAAEAKYMVNDLAFLKDTFKNGETNISGGVVMTEMVAVGEGGKNIEAFLNGSDFAESNDNGKLILAGGIPATSKSGSTDLKDRAKEAKTRLYKDGHLTTKEAEIEGKIVAKTGQIANFEITGSRIGVADNGTTTGMHLSKSYISFRDNTTREGDSGTYKRFSAVGSNVNPSTTYEGLARFELSANDDYQASFGTAYGIQSSVSGYKNPYAFYCGAGQFAGLRPKVRRVTSTTKTTLDKLDHTILCVRSDGATIPIGLPTEKENGQCYEIWKWGNCGLTLTASNNIARLGQGSSTSQGIGNEWFGIIKLIYSADDAAWLMTLHKTE